ncbi:DUF4349 domain-containing protein [Oceanobacillus alkalisoli]|uniref:DUF4349 domain-containing protein n=1 Tax=Oceanobacillus alkalisoli TaxID=2925113 RepID=UPI001EF05494|nr:DUF4349 domain-containing protein [Oceanobacillus alkalisoli]MCF3943274.1 DUF4349 domain-containing protein [Oceanobacillus alkalisoli]MCG5103849.1 DUF4349 domain-containing protein [Oceanobacillus alkalisoli]
MSKYLIILMFSFLLAACTSNGADNSAEEMADIANETESYGMEESEQQFSEANKEEAQDVETESAGNDDGLATVEANRKVIYTADISVETDDFEVFSNVIQKEAKKIGGYVLESTLYNEQVEDLKGGQMTVRIPQEDFHTFLDVIEEGSTKVLDHYVSGEDVTEEFVDLESRLKSKEQVEERLLEFLDGAEKTEDLLKISNDLAIVQEEVEMIVGRMNYLQDKTDFSTVTISIQERHVTLSSVNDGDLNTWGETKQQFMKSINFLISAFSALTIFLIGNLPILITVGALMLISFFIWRKQKKNKSSGPGV